MSCAVPYFDISQWRRCRIQPSDSENISLFGDERIAVGVAFFFGMLIHYIFTLLIHGMKKGNKDEFIHVERIFAIYGAATIFSYNLIQGGVYQGIFAWFTLICFILIHLPAINDSFVGARNKFWLAFYFFLWMWFWGIIVDTFDAYKNV